jgi:hypothetical protein
MIYDPAISTLQASSVISFDENLVIYYPQKKNLVIYGWKHNTEALEFETNMPRERHTSSNLHGTLSVRV